jgi:hypothetical protein
MGYPARFATPTNGWDRLFEGALPRWLMVNDQAALKGFYEGNSSLYRWEHISAWLVPSLYWMLFAGALFVSFLCLAVLLRQQWVESERLTFPIVQLPMAIAESPKAFFSDKLVWVGVDDRGRDYASQRGELPCPLRSQHRNKAAGLQHVLGAAVERRESDKGLVLLLCHYVGLSDAPGPVRIVLVFLSAVSGRACVRGLDGSRTGQ